MRLHRPVHWLILGMLQGYCLLWINWLGYASWLLRHLWAGFNVVTARHLLLLCVGLPAALLWYHVHWLFLLLDELLFWGYRRIEVGRALFIIGVPRSGTTFLQRTLSDDDQFTTTTLAECLLTPAISQRYLAHLGRRLWLPLGRLKGLGRSRFSRKMDAVHPLGLDQAEEDFLLLLPICSCFIEMVALPQCDRVWRLAFFDQQLGLWQRRAVMTFYHRLVQRHLYFHGADKTYLSKNPSFTPLIGSLTEQFPEATLVACVRPPEQTVPSQLRSLQPAFELLRHDLTNPAFVSRIETMLAHYYREIERWSGHEHKVLVVEFAELKSQLFICLLNLYHSLGLTIPPTQRAEFEQLAEQNKSFRSHQEANNEAPTGYEAPAFEHLWPLDKSQRLVSFSENMS